MSSFFLLSVLDLFCAPLTAARPEIHCKTSASSPSSVIPSHSRSAERDRRMLALCVPTDGSARAQSATDTDCSLSINSGHNFPSLALHLLRSKRTVSCELQRQPVHSISVSTRRADTFKFCVRPICLRLEFRTGEAHFSLASFNFEQ